MNDLGLYGLYERYDMGGAIVRECPWDKRIQESKPQPKPN